MRVMLGLVLVFLGLVQPQSTGSVGLAVRVVGGGASTIAPFLEETSQVLAGEGLTVQWGLPAPLPADVEPLGTLVLQVGERDAQFVTLVAPSRLVARSPFLNEIAFPAFPLDTDYSVSALALQVAYAVGDCETTAAFTMQLSDVPHLYPSAQVMLGNCYLGAGDYLLAGEALAPLAEAASPADVIGSPVLETAVFHSAWGYLQQGLPQTGLALIDPLVAYTRGNPAAPLATARMYARRAKLHALAFNFDMAIADITAAIDLDPDNPRYYKQRGDHIFLIYEWDRVLADYNRAVDLDPAYADAYFSRGVLYYTQGPRPAALDDFQQFVTLAHENDPRITQAETYMDSIEAELDALGGDDTGPFGPGD